MIVKEVDLIREREKIVRSNLQRKVVSAPQAERAPPGRAKVQFLVDMGRFGRWEWLIL